MNARRGVLAIAALLVALALAASACGGDDAVTVRTDGATVPTTNGALATMTGDFLLRMASADQAGNIADASSGGASISGDGAFVAFASSAGNLVSDDSNGLQDIFLKDSDSGVIVRVSTSSSGAQADGPSGTSTTSGDGRYVAYWSEATNLTASDTNGVRDVFVMDMLSGSTTIVSADTGGAYGNAASDMPAIADEGRFIAFRSAAANLVADDANGKLDVFVRNMVTGTTTMVSTSSSGVPGDADSSDTYPPAISADGRYVAFESAAANLVPGDNNGQRDIFVKDLETGTTRRVSETADGVEGDGSSLYASISDNGRFVLFRSSASSLVPGDTLMCDTINCSDIFLKDLETGAITRVSTDAAGKGANAASWDPALSGDGRYAAFSSDATNLAPVGSSGVYNIFVKEISTGAVFLVSKNGDGRAGDGWSIGPYLSADGLCVVFQTAAANLVPGDTNGVPDIIFAVDQPAGE
ncbi:MAG: TolB family protein [Thermoleophilia bacterium]